MHAVFSLIIQKYFIEFFYSDVTDYHQVPPIPLVYHHGEPRKMCGPTYHHGVMLLLNRPFCKHELSKLAACANNLMDSFPYKYMSRL